MIEKAGRDYEDEDGFRLPGTIVPDVDGTQGLGRMYSASSILDGTQGLRRMYSANLVREVKMCNPGSVPTDSDYLTFQLSILVDGSRNNPFPCIYSG